MKCYVTKNQKLATRTTTFNMTEESLSIVKNTVKGLKELGVYVTQGEVINHLISAYAYSQEKIYQVDGEEYSVKSLCKKAVDIFDDSVEEYINNPEIVKQVDDIYNELVAFVKVKLKDAEAELEEAEEKLECEYEKLDEWEKEQKTLEEYIVDEGLEYEVNAYIEHKDIKDEISKHINMFRNSVSNFIFGRDFEYVSNFYVVSPNIVENITEYFFPSYDSMLNGNLIECVKYFDRKKTLSDLQVSYILKEYLDKNPSNYHYGEGILEILRASKRGDLNITPCFFVKVNEDADNCVAELPRVICPNI